MAEGKITGLAHIGIKVRDMAASLKFYTEVLGFEKTGEQMFGTSHLAFLNIGTCILGIFDADAAGRLLELEGQRAACLIAMGYPEQWKNGPGRKETEELLSFR